MTNSNAYFLSVSGFLRILKAPVEGQIVPN
jgi:hypothetical protein